jgi:hypothetical protein
LPLSADVIEDSKYLAIGKRVRTIKASVKVGAVIGDFSQCVIDLVLERHGFGVDIGKSDSTATFEWHLPIKIKGATRVYAYRKRI